MKKLWNSKILYIILLIIVSIAFAGSIIIRVVVPDFSSRSNFPSNISGGQFSGSDFDPSQFSQLGGSSGQMPSGFDPSQFFQQGGDSSQTPSGFDPSQFFQQGGDGSDSSSGGFSFPGNMPSRDGRDNSERNSTRPETTDRSQKSNSGFLQWVRKGWLPIMLISLAIMIFCIIRLIMISKKEKKDRQDKEDKKYKGLSQDEILKSQVKEEAELAVENRNKKRTTSIILSCVLVLVIVFVVVAGKLLTGDTKVVKNTEVDEKVLSANVEKADIKTVLRSSGTIAMSDSTDIVLPGTVSIAKWLVKNGDTVAIGDKLAEVNTDSVASAISDLRSLIAKLDADLEASKEDVISSDVTSVASGRVIKIFAKESELVTDIMAEYGALLLLSLDGTLAVTLPLSNNVAVGEDVQVVVSDEAVYAGKVASKDLDQMVVTISDEYALSGETTTVSDTDGQSLGSGTLYVHSAQNITGFTGAISEIKVAEGDEVEAEDVLMVLEDAEYSMVYEQLLQKRTTLESQLQTLLLAYASGYLYAEADGVVSGIEDDSAVESLAATTANTGIVATIQSENIGRLVASIGVYSDVSSRTSVLSDPEEGEQENNDPSEGEPSENEPSGNEPSGNEPSGNEPSGNEPTGNEPSGNNPSGNNPSGGRTDGPGGWMNGGGGSGTFPSFNGNGGNFSGYTGNGTSSQQTVVEEDEAIDVSKYELSETSFCSITPNQEMTIDISIDEHDISLISLGMTVTVSLDAYPGRSFEGTVSQIATEGTNNGGSSKFTVTVTILPDTVVLSGMNASVLIDKEIKNQAISIPLEAVYEEGTKTFVYTSYDEKKDELSAPVEIQLGLSDGDHAEVLSGLSIGDTFYYRYAGTITYNFINRLSK